MKIKFWLIFVDNLLVTASQIKRELSRIYFWQNSTFGCLFNNTLQKSGHAKLACMSIILTGKNRQVTLDKWPIMRSMFNHARTARPPSAMHSDALKS